MADATQAGNMRRAIDVDPVMVRWARESAGLTVEAAAKKVGVKPDKFRGWEDPDKRTRPTARQLERLADAVKRPVAAFFLSEPPKEAVPADFRRAEPAGHTLDPATLVAIRKARRLRRLYDDVAIETAGSVAKQALPQLYADTVPDEAAQRIRELFDVPIGVQAKWQGPSNALRAWRSKVEERGFLVFQLAMPSKLVSGFSLTNSLAAIVLNKRDAASRRCFTLFHELAHVLLRNPGLCYVEEGRAPNAGSHVEVFCNAFAAGFLVPGDALKQTPAYGLVRNGGPETLDNATTSGARMFSVSREVILRRFLTLGVIQLTDYQQKLEEWKQQRFPVVRRTSKTGPPPHLKAVAELGHRYVSGVLRAHDRGLISDVEVADHLSLKLRHLEKVEALIARTA